MANITPQKSLEEMVEEIEMQRTQSESTFTKHTKSINAIIKEVLLGLILIIQLYQTYKLSK